jgi:LysR family nitrogen assimilation transcriptional regulator
LGLCVSVHLPTTNAKRAVCALIGDVMRELCESGQWAGARVVGPEKKPKEPKEPKKPKA